MTKTSRKMRPKAAPAAGRQSAPESPQSTSFVFDFFESDISFAVPVFHPGALVLGFAGTLVTVVLGALIMVATTVTCMPPFAASALSALANPVEPVFFTAAVILLAAAEALATSPVTLMLKSTSTPTWLRRLPLSFEPVMVTSVDDTPDEAATVVLNAAFIVAFSNWAFVMPDKPTVDSTTYTISAGAAGAGAGAAGAELEAGALEEAALEEAAEAYRRIGVFKGCG